LSERERESERENETESVFVSQIWRTVRETQRQPGRQRDRENGERKREGACARVSESDREREGERGLMQRHTGIDIGVRTGIDIGVRGSGLVENNTRRKATALAAAGGEVVHDTGLEILRSKMRIKDNASKILHD
jgi:hypothetical protein